MREDPASVFNNVEPKDTVRSFLGCWTVFITVEESEGLLHLKSSVVPQYVWRMEVMD